MKQMKETKFSSKFSLTKRLKSFAYAFNGLKILIKEEHNARIHLFLTFLVILMGIIFKINHYEWIIIIFAIGLVFALETVNSAIENMADFVCNQQNEKIKKIKDLSAAAVLITAIAAGLIGIIIFLPKIIVWVKNVSI